MARASTARPRGRSGPSGALADPAAVAFLAAVLLAVVQAVVLGEPSSTMLAAVPYATGFLVVVLVRLSGPRDEAGLLRWNHALAVAGVLLSVWLTGAFLGALPTGLGAGGGLYTVKVAVTSPVGDHNTAAGLLLPGIVAMAILAAHDRRWRLGLAAGTLGLVATLSRGGALVLLGLALVAWVTASDRRVARLLTAAAVAAVAAVSALTLVLNASVPEEVGADGGPQFGASTFERVDLARRGLEVGLEEPVLGVGLGRFEEVTRDLPPPNDHAHQLLAHAFAEGGTPLLAVAVVVPVVLVRRTLARPDGPGRDLLLLGGLGLLAHAQIEILGGRPGYEVLLALLVGLAGSPSGSDREGRGAPGA